MPKPVAPELTQERGDGAEPRPATLATQELRLALAFTGGVSLAIWMGGIAREVDHLVQSSDRRRVPGQGPVDPATPDEDPVRRLYRRLLDLLDVQVAVDVLSGTSAGGINAALLGLVNVRRLDLGPLRDIWLSAGALDQLLRDPREADPPSLLKGDGRLLTALNAGISSIVGQRAGQGSPRRADVFITTTLLSPESSRFADDYGTQITDTDHHAQFHFDESTLVQKDVAAPLALAARSSASFPAAFEPSYVPFGEADADPTHSDMSTYSNTTRSHWAADGGLLVNRPIAPVLQSIFDRGADRQVRRTLLYVVPSSGSTATQDNDEQTKPLGLADALLSDLGATLNQSIAADLATIKEHNDRNHAAADTRLRLASLGARLPAGGRLADAAAWVDYRERQGEWLIAPLVSEVTRQLGTLPGLPQAWTSAPGNTSDQALRSVAKAQVTASWPTAPPPDALAAAAGLGRPAFDTAKATLLRLLRLGYVLATSVEDRNSLAKLGTRVHGALSETRRTDLRGFVKTHMTAAASRPGTTLEEAFEELTTAYTQEQGTPDELSNAWTIASDIERDAASLLERLVTSAGDPPVSSGSSRPSLPQRRALATQELTTYLSYLKRGGWVAQLLDLHVVVRSVLPVLLEVEQPVELIQVSADTKTLLSARSTAAEKLTGMQLHHFGAFYKTSWRANDWMWGRLDGCGWLVHVLLDPRRILTVMENDAVAPGLRAQTFAARLQDTLEAAPIPADLLVDLAFLDDDALPVPASLPQLSLWAAEVLQRHIAAEELQCVAAHMRTGPEGEPSVSGTSWLAAFDEADKLPAGPGRRDALANLLSACPVPGETLQGERTSPLFLRTLTQTVAVATAAGTAMKQPPASLRPTFATARSITQTAYIATDKTHGKRRETAFLGVALLIIGVLAMLTKTVWLGLPGLVLFGAGTVLLALCIGRTTASVLQVVLALAVVLLAAAPWLPWLGEHVFSWLKLTAIPWVQKEKWAWPVLLLLLLLPPVTTAFGWLKKRRPAAS